MDISGKISVGIIAEEKVSLPEYKFDGDSGMDVKTIIHEPVTLEPLERFTFPTGIKLKIPYGYEVQVRPRSGLAAKYGLTVLNTPGTIDSNYQGEIKVILVNLSNENRVINPGERIAQLVLTKVEFAKLEEINDFEDKTDRGEGGLGHSGEY